MKILQQDDTAPDALEYFQEQLIRETGLSLWDFQQKAFRADFPMGMIWSHKGYRLSWFADDPFYTLEKI